MIKITQTCESGHETPITKRTSKCYCGKEVGFKLDKFDFLSTIDKSKNSMWRYKNILPIKEENIITAGEGNTPIINLREIGDRLGISLYVKLETENPTGTFKDREASFVISRSKEIKENNLVLQSTGNTAIAMTYYAGLASLNSYAFIP
jgi:threonine synthase